MADAKSAVKELQDKCGLPAKECQAALRAHGGAVDAALGALIDAGKVKADCLDPETVSAELFERAARRDKVSFFEQMMDPSQGLLGMIGKTMKQAKAPTKHQKEAAEAIAQFTKDMFGGKTAEEFVDQEVAERHAEVKKRGYTPMPDGEQARLRASVHRRHEALKKKPVTLKLKPFPPLKLALSEWRGEDVLAAWKGTQERHGGYNSLSSAKPSKGTLKLVIPRLDDNDQKPRPPAKEQVAAYAYLKDNQDEVTDAIMHALLDYYTKLRKDWLKDNPKLKLPVIDTVEQMRKNVGLGTLYMQSVAKKGVAYIGLEMGCTWDEEHGVGVMMYKDRVLSVGQAEEAFATWLGTEDGGKALKK
jgi:hypothetical protein